MEKEKAIGKKGKRAPVALRDPKAPVDLRVPRAHLAHPDLQGLQESLDFLDTQAPMPWDPQDHPDHLDLQGPLDLQDHRDLLDHRDQVEVRKAGSETHSQLWCTCKVRKRPYR
ncbi:hypothetical protein MHYP_G00275250 [Metynnis hypsauchen]